MSNFSILSYLDQKTQLLLSFCTR